MYAPRSIRTFTNHLPGIRLENLIPLKPVAQQGDVAIISADSLSHQETAALLVVVSKNAREIESVHAFSTKQQYEILDHFYFGLFVLPFLWLRNLPGGNLLLRRIFMAEIWLHPYLQLLAGIGTLAVLQRREHSPPRLRRKAKISCVIPAYNEAQRLPRYLKEIQQYFKIKRVQHEILVVDDGSSDGTARTIQKLFPQIRVIQLYENFGKGAAVREGVLAASGDYILIADADGATPIEEIAALERAISEGYDIAIGSRYLAQSKIGKRQNLVRRIVSRTGNLLIRTLLNLPFRDTQCGFKLFTHRSARQLFQRLTNIRFGFDFEILKKAALMQFKVAEVPVRWNDQAGSKVTLRLTLRVLYELLHFRFGHLTKFAFVGLVNTFVDFSIHNALILFVGNGSALRQLFYMVIAFLCANLVAFCLHSGFTFQKRAAYSRFFTVSIFTLALSALLFYSLNLLYNPANSIVMTNICKLTTILVNFTANYFGYRFWVYRYGV